MALRTNTAEGGTNATTVTTGNSGGSSGDAFSSISIGTNAAAVFSNANAAHGSLSYALTTASSAAVFISWNGYNATSFAARMYFNMGSTVPSVQQRILDVRSSSATAARVALNTTGKLSVQDTTGASLYGFSATLAANTWYRIEFAISVSATAATIKCDYYLGDASTPVSTGYSTVSGNTGSANITEARYGFAAATTWVGTSYLDDIAANDGTTTYVGAYSGAVTAPSAPTNVSAVSGNGQATVSFTAGSDGGSPITSYTVTSSPGGITGMVSGASATPVTVSGLTNGTSYTFTAHATNAIGNSSESGASTAVIPSASSSMILSNYAEGGANGTTVTTANSGGASGSAFTSVAILAGATGVYSTAAAAHGSLGYAFTGGSSAAAYVGWTGYSTNSLAARFYLNVGSTIPAVAQRILDIRSSSATAARLILNTTGKISVQDSTGTTVFTMATTLSTATYYRIELAVSVSTTSATIQFDYYLGDAATPIATGYSTTTGNTGSTALAEVRFGLAAAVTSSDLVYFDDIATAAGTTNYVGPYTTPAPTANAGTNQQIPPYMSVTFAGSATTAPGHSATYSWAGSNGSPAITSGGTSLTPTISSVGGPLVPANSVPIDVTYTYTLTVLQDDAQTATANVSITITFGNRYLASSGSWKPQPTLKRSHSGSWV